MKKIKEIDLLSIYKREQQHLITAIKNGSDPYHFFSLSTIDNQIASSRMVVLRNIQLNPFKIFFNCDVRSPKVKQLKEQNECMALFYNQKRKIQMRMMCTATLNYKNNLSEQIWEKTPLQSRKCYMGDFNPSSTTNEWHPNVPLNYINRDPDKNESAKGYKNFVHVELSIISCDILELHYDGHVRFMINNNDKVSFLAP